MSPPRVIDRHGVVTSVVVEDETSYIITQARVKGVPPQDSMMKPRRYYSIEPGLPDDPEVALIYCKRGKHDVTVSMSDLREALARYRRGETQVRVLVEPLSPNAT